MTVPRTILCVVGTRPEAVKMAPVVLELRRRPWARVRVLATAQHRQMLDQVLGLFGIQPDVDLDLMRPNQGLADLTARMLTALDGTLEAEGPAAVLAQGDTTTVLTTALACFYRRIPFGHVEAGLRTGDLDYPFPEEMNRSVAGRLARLHFAPTESARANLLREGTDPASIHVTGNTVIDALLQVAAREAPLPEGVPDGRRLILVTAHRRENFGEPLRQICRALRTLAERNPDVHVLYPVHLNPNVTDVVRPALGAHPRVTLCEPLDYLPFVAAMKRSTLILSDSGGVQEEAPALGKPVLVLRAETERPEAVEAGVVKLVGTSESAIVAEAQRLLDDPAAYRAMARGVSPYGDGHAAERIADVLQGVS
jgi:UDP-N-acetylglucosamine 2-epimerase (non-hydrolysing)